MGRGDIRGRSGDIYARAAEPLRPSLSAAGLGSLYVTVDFLGMSAPGAPRQRSNRKLPAALRPVLDEVADTRDASEIAGLEMDVVRQAYAGWQRVVREKSIDCGPTSGSFISCMPSNGVRVSARSSKENITTSPRGTTTESVCSRNCKVKTEPGERRASDSIRSPMETDPPVSTAFAMLFLLRSTQETIEKVIERDGILRGGYDLPSDLTEVRLQGNRLVAPAITGEVADLIGMLENDAADNIESLLDSPDLLSLSGLTGEGREYTARLARVIRTGSFQARLIAARLLGRQGELDNVPILIFALTDPDPRVMREAQAGLRLTSRKFDGFDLPANPQKAEIGGAGWPMEDVVQIGAARGGVH